MDRPKQAGCYGCSIPLEPNSNSRASIYRKAQYRAAAAYCELRAPRSTVIPVEAKALGNLREPGRKGNIRTWRGQLVPNPFGVSCPGEL